jgi:hypothetical protein
MRNDEHSVARKLFALLMILFFSGSLAIGQGITSFPYYQNFDGTVTGWTTGGTASTWALGAPSASIINTPSSPPNVYATNLSGNYSSNELSWVQSPEFDFTLIPEPVVEFKMWYETQTGYTDGVTFQYSLDAGLSWDYLGIGIGALSGDPNGDNWFNTMSIEGLAFYNGWAGNTGAWETMKYYAFGTNALVDLSNETSVTFRFLFGSNSSTVQNGVAIDDFQVYQTPNNDLRALSVSIDPSCIGSTSLSNVYLEVKNEGSAQQTSFSITYSADGGATFVSETITDTLNFGDTETYTFSTQADFTTIGTYNLVGTVNLTGDQNQYNDTVYAQVETVGGALTEDFESWGPTQTTNSCTSGTLGATGTSGWYQDQTDGGEWRLDYGGTGSTNTGPATDFDPGTSAGYYLYSETSGCYGATINLISPCFDFSSSAYKLKFAYHMWGAAMGSLSVDAWDGTQWVNDVWTISGDQGNVWNEIEVGLGAFNNSDAQMRIRTVSGTTYTSDCAIDAIELVQLLPNNTGILSVYPTSFCPGTVDLYATVHNAGNNAIASVDVHWSMDGIAQTTNFYSSTIATGGIDTVFLGQYTFAAATQYDMLVWTANPNGGADPITANDSLAINGFQASLSGTFYIGGATPHFTDFTAAVAALVNFGVCGPVVFEAAPGTYVGQLTIPDIVGADSVNNITFTSTTGDSTDVIVQYAASGASDNWVWKIAQDYVTISNISIESTTGTNYGRVIHMDGTNYSTITNCEIISVSVTSSLATPIYSYNDKSDNYNTFSYNKIKNGYYGIYFYGSNSNYENNNMLIGNEITDFYYYGTYFYYQNSTKVKGNYIQQSSAGSSTSYNVYFYYVKEEFEVTHNEIVDFSGATFYGMRIYYVTGNATTNGLIANNFISNSGTTGTAYGMYIYNTSHVKVYNNSVHISSGGTTSYGMYFNDPNCTYSNVQFKNNNIVNSKGGYAVYINDDMFLCPILFSSGNNLYTSGTTLARLATTNLPTLADWQNYYPLDLLNDPGGFTGANDLHTNAVALNGAASPLAEVTDDIDGDVRDAVSPDVGADEFVPVDEDAGVIDILGLSGVCPGSADVTAEINNFGLVDLWSVTINWSVNGVTQTPVVYTDTLAVGASTAVLLGSYSFASGLSYDISAWTSLPNGIGDGNSANDQFDVLGMGTAISGNYTVGATGDFATITDAADFMTMNGVCGPVVIDIQPGTYTGAVTLGEIGGNDSINNITFQSLSGVASDVVVEFAGSSNTNWVWKFNGVDWCTVQNITIKSIATGNYGHVVTFHNGSNHNTLTGCDIQSVYVTSSLASGIRSYNDSKDEYNTISNNTITGGYYGIYWYTSTAQLETGNEFHNNTIVDYYYYGLYTYYQHSVKINGNYIEQLSSGSATNYPLYAYYADGYIEVTNNHIYDGNGSTCYGLRAYYCDNLTSTPSLIANNMIGIENLTGTKYGLYVYNSLKVNIYHNSVYINTASGTGYAGYLYMSSGSYGPYDVKNNSFVNMSSAGYAMYGSGNGMANFSSTNNNLYTNSALLCDFTTDYPTLSDWQNVSPGDVLNSTANYLGADDLHSLSPLLDGGGTPVAEVQFDIDGEVRDLTTPDVGADEFVMPNNDVAVNLIYHYGEVPIEGGADQVIAMVMNVGLNDQLNFPVTLNITGANTYTNIITLPLLASGQLDTIYFDGFTPTATGWNNIMVSVPTDENNSNNSQSGVNQATQNVFAYADTSGADGGGQNAGGFIYWTKYYLDGLKQISEIQAYVPYNANNAGNTVYGAVMDANNNAVILTDPYILTANDSNTYITLTFPNPSLTATANDYFYAGLAQEPPVGGSYKPVGWQLEDPMRWDTYFHTNLAGGNLVEYTNQRRWMIKAKVEDPAPYDANMLAITSPEEDCSIGLQTINVQVQNNGSAVMNSFSLSYSVNGTTPVTEVVSASVLPGDIYSYGFTTQFDFIAPVADSLYNIIAWVDLAQDTLQYNDTTAYEVVSLYTPPAPTAVNATVIYGDMATLGAISNDTCLWYETLTSPSPFGMGNAVTIGPLFDTTTVYVQATIPASALAITEIDVGGPDYIEIANLGTAEFDASGWFVAVSNSYTNINLFNTNVWNLGIIPGETALYKTDSSSDNYWGSNLLWNPGASGYGGWAVIVDDQGNIADFVMFGGFTAADLAGWNPTINGFSLSITDEWIGDGCVTTVDVAYRTQFDTNTAADWTIQAVGNKGAMNSPMNVTVALAGCSSALVPVTATVTNIPDYNAGVVAGITPQSAAELTIETVCIEIENTGGMPISGFPVAYETSTTIVTEIFTGIILPGDVTTYCFSIPIDITAFGTYNFCAYTILSGDTWTANDTACWTVENTPLLYCNSSATSTAYEELIEVSLGNFTNNSGPAFGSMYQDFTTIPTLAMSPGMTYPISITSDYAPGYTSSYNCYVEVYIDWNHDGTWDETSDELVFGSTSSSSTTVTGTVVVPITAQAGHHGMRVVFREGGNAGSVTPCGTYTWGETEDYFVTVVEPMDHDAGATTFLAPVQTPTLTENDIVPVEVVVFNLGLLPLSSMDVVFTVDGTVAQTIVYTGTLQSFESDTVMFTDLTIPGGYSNLCAYTVLQGDTNYLNDTVCMQLYALPQYDLEMVSIDAPINGCNMGLEDVTITFTNLGDSIMDGIDVAYFMNTMTTPVVENFTDTIPSGATLTYTFATQVDLSVTVDTEFDFTAYLSYLNDPVQLNDTTMEVIGSYVSPDPPVANGVTIWSSEIATLTITNPDTTQFYNWFLAADTSLMTTNDTLITPQLFDTTTYLVEASAGGGSGSLTTTYASNNGQAGNMVDVTALTGNITIESFDVNIDGSVTMEVWYKPGSYVGFETNAGAWTLLGSANIVSNGANVPTPCPIGGLTIPYGETYALYITTTGGSINYTTLSAPPYHTDGNLLIDNSCGKSYPFGSTFNPRDWNGTIYYSSGNGCTSAFVPVTVAVQYADYDGGVVDVISPTSWCNLGNEDVTIDIYNNGLNAISNFPVYYSINGNPVSETITSVIMPGDTLTHTFSTLANLTAFGSYAFCAGVTVPQDGYNLNDEICWNVENWNGCGLSCTDAFPYGEPGDPAVTSELTFAFDSEWWRFSISDPYENVVVSLCGSLFDTQLQLWDSCGALGASYTNDNFCGIQSQISVPVIMQPGTYYVRVLGYNIAFGEFTLEISGNKVPKFIIDLVGTDISCFGGNDGSIVSSILPGNAGTQATYPITYAWDPTLPALATQNNLTAGTYSVSVTDFDGWTEVAEITLTEPDLIEISGSITDATVFGTNDGAIDITISGGVSPYTYAWSNGAAVEDPTAIYASLHSVTVTDDNNCDMTADFSVVSPIPDSSWISLPTAATHNIIVPFNALVTLDGTGVEPGSVIGVFYNNGGTLSCSGYTFWSGMDATIVAYGTDPGMGNGFAPGESFTWKVWDVAETEEFGGNATYNATMYPNTSAFAIGGLSGVQALEFQSIITQNITLPSGWSIWSTYIDPLDPNIAMVMADIVSPPFTIGDVEIVKNGAGQIFWPFYGLNTIGNVVIGEGYQVKINGTLDVTFGVTGLQIAPEITPFTVAAGWSILGYLRDNPATIDVMLAPLTAPCFIPGCLEIVKNGNGQIYWPFYCLNTIGDMIPGEGYQVKNNCVATNFTYPSNAGITGTTKSDFGTIDPVKYELVRPTGDNMTIGFPEEAWNVQPSFGDEIGVFTASDELIGSAIFVEGFTAITVWGTELIEKSDKGSNGQMFKVKLWNSTDGEERDLIVDWSQGSDEYISNAINIAGELTLAGSDKEFALGQNMPNPFTGSTRIPFYLPEDCDVTIAVYNAIGELVIELISENRSAGAHTVEFDASKLEAGNYFYKLVTDKFTSTKPMSIK